MRAAWRIAPPIGILVALACTGDDTTSDGPFPDAGVDALAVTDGGAPRQEDASADAGRPGVLFAFAGCADGRIRSYLVDETSGAWTARSVSDAGANPSFLAFDPSRRRVVAIDETNDRVRAFAFDEASGAVRELSNQPSGGSGPAHVSLDPTGAWAFVANYGGGTMEVLPLASDGTLGDATATRASGAMSHWAGTDKSGRHVLVTSLGADHVAEYTLQTDGTLTADDTAPVDTGLGPRHLAFHPSERWAYVVDETAISVTTFDYDTRTGKLIARGTVSALPPGQSKTGVSGAEIAMHPSGKWLYASTRIYDAIALFTIDQTSGMATWVTSFSTGGDRPRSFALDPEGTLLYAANQDKGEIVGYRIGDAGTLLPLGKIADVPGPAFVGMVRMPR